MTILYIKNSESLREKQRVEMITINIILFLDLSSCTLCKMILFFSPHFLYLYSIGVFCSHSFIFFSPILFSIPFSLRPMFTNTSKACLNSVYSLFCIQHITPLLLSPFHSYHTQKHFTVSKHKPLLFFDIHQPLLFLVHLQYSF